MKNRIKQRNIKDKKQKPEHLFRKTDVRAIILQIKYLNI